jgi:hypothetical protein
MSLPEHILKRIRQRHDLDENDQSRDAEFNTMEPARAFEEVVCWELGDARWATLMLSWASDCGFDIKPN